MSEQWPPSDGLSTPLVPRSEAILTSVGTATINAPAELVYEAVCNVAKYPEWNNFVPRVTIHKQPAEVDPESQMLETGTSFTFHVVMDAAKPTKETATQLLVTDTSTPLKPSDYLAAETLAEDDTYSADLQSVYRISWKTEGGFVSRGLRSERFHEIIIHGDNECEVRTWENMGGVLAHTVSWLYKKVLEQKFQLWCADLKKYCEQKANAAE